MRVYNLIFIINKDICVYVYMKSPLLKISHKIGDFNYSFFDTEVKINAITIISIRSTNNLLTNKFIFNKLYKI